MKIQFSIRDLLLIIAIVALAAGWWIDHQRINRLSVQKWDYLAMDGMQEDSPAWKRQSDDGWELCGLSFSPKTNNFFAVFKRPQK